MKPVSRRKFLTYSALSLAGSSLPVRPLCAITEPQSKTGSENIAGKPFKNDAPKQLWKWSRKADYSITLPDNAVICGICPHGCILDDGDRSICRSRVNINGNLHTLTYGNPCSVNTDPIEKKTAVSF